MIACENACETKLLHVRMHVRLPLEEVHGLFYCKYMGSQVAVEGGCESGVVHIE